MFAFIARRREARIERLTFDRGMAWRDDDDERVAQIDAELERLTRKLARA